MSWKLEVRTNKQINNSTIQHFNKKKLSRTKKALLAVSALLLILLALAFPRLGTFLVLEDDLQPADAIVILMGNTPVRELETADLYHAGLADQILMVEFTTHRNLLLDSFNIDMPRGLSNTVSVLNQLGVPAESITILPGDISSTRGEAIAIRQYLETAPHIHTIIIVSSPHHMRRTRLIFRRELRKLNHDVELILRPSNYSDFQPNGWYRHRESARSVVLEYLKIVGWVFRL